MSGAALADAERPGAASGDLTLLLGPPTRLAHELNAMVREGRARLAEADIRALPQRPAARLLWRAMDGDEAGEDLFARAEAGPGERVVLSAIQVFGGDKALLEKGEILPGLEASLARLAPAIGARAPLVVLTLDALHRVFADIGSDMLAARVAATPWDALYELSWADFADAFREALPEARVLVVTPSSAAVRARDLLARLFGDEGAAALDPARLLRVALTPAGQAALDRLSEAGAVGPERAEELLAAFAEAPDPGDLRRRFGIDPVTAALLDQRFAEDLATLEAMAGIEVL